MLIRLVKTKWGNFIKLQLHKICLQNTLLHLFLNFLRLLRKWAGNYDQFEETKSFPNFTYSLGFTTELSREIVLILCHYWHETRQHRNNHWTDLELKSKSWVASQVSSLGMAETTGVNTSGQHQTGRHTMWACLDFSSRWVAAYPIEKWSV